MGLPGALEHDQSDLEHEHSRWAGEMNPTTRAVMRCSQRPLATGAAMPRAHNFGAGPAVLPIEVVEECKKHLADLEGSGLGLMETSHRSETFQSVIDEATSRLRDLLSIPQDYSVLLLQGGASLQFHMVPLNLLAKGEQADVIVTGKWSQNTLTEMNKIRRGNSIWDGAEGGFNRIPSPAEYKASGDSIYVHYTSNNTIYGTQFKQAPDCDGRPLVVDASSDICGVPLDVSAHEVIYAGAQKNLGPSGVTVCILSPWAIAKANPNLPSMLDYKTQKEKGSMFNTPNTYGIFVLREVLRWIDNNGGVEAAHKRNKDKADMIYSAIDSSSFWTPHAEQGSRSIMNATFRIADESLLGRFIAEAEDLGLKGLRGHRIVGGIRASMYNGLELGSVERLVGFMRDFENRHS